MLEVTWETINFDLELGLRGIVHLKWSKVNTQEYRPTCSLPESVSSSCTTEALLFSAPDLMTESIGISARKTLQNSGLCTKKANLKASIAIRSKD